MNEVYHDSIDASNQELRYIIDELKEENKHLKRKNSCERRLTDDRDRELANLTADLSEVRGDLDMMTKSRDYWINLADERNEMVRKFERKWLDRGEELAAYSKQVDSLKQLVEERGDRIDHLANECKLWEEDYDRLVLIRDQLEQDVDALKQKLCQDCVTVEDKNMRLIQEAHQLRKALKEIADTAQEAYHK
jgi:chromosome segregation ATPase